MINGYAWHGEARPCEALQREADQTLVGLGLVLLSNASQGPAWQG